MSSIGAKTEGLSEPSDRALRLQLIVLLVTCIFSFKFFEIAARGENHQSHIIVFHTKSERTIGNHQNDLYRSQNESLCKNIHCPKKKPHCHTVLRNLTVILLLYETSLPRGFICPIIPHSRVGSFVLLYEIPLSSGLILSSDRSKASVGFLRTGFLRPRV